ncbi:MAG: dihydroneopterin aldolase [Bacteroidetes bacterium]|nr:dihydroneopterin aldolase [Bacteroidota bacterium]
MLTVSLHGIRLHAKVGLYPEEKIHGNDFEIDVDVSTAASAGEALPFLDYSIIYEIVLQAFSQEGELIEAFAKSIHTKVKQHFFEAEKVRVAIRKLNPPIGGTVRHAQVCLEA